MTNWRKKQNVLARWWATPFCQNIFREPWHWFYKSLELCWRDEDLSCCPISCLDDGGEERCLTHWSKSPIVVLLGWDLVTVWAITYDSHHFHNEQTIQPYLPNFRATRSPYCRGQAFRLVAFSQYKLYIHSLTAPEYGENNSSSHITFFHNSVDQCLWFLHPWTPKCTFIFGMRGLHTATLP